MKLRILCVGKSHDKYFVDAISDYERRLPKHVTLSWEIIPSADINTESEMIFKKASGYCILLDETGTTWTTPEFAQKIEHLQNISVKEITFIIGGAYGVTDSVKVRSDQIWSLSTLVFPHQLVRVILVEQLYRAYDLLTGGKYHHS